MNTAEGGLNSLDDDRSIGNQTLDIQVIRAEGFCFWQKHITLSEHYAA